MARDPTSAALTAFSARRSVQGAHAAPERLFPSGRNLIRPQYLAGCKKAHGIKHNHSEYATNKGAAEKKSIALADFPEKRRARLVIMYLIFCISYTMGDSKHVFDEYVGFYHNGAPHASLLYVGIFLGPTMRYNSPTLKDRKPDLY